MKSLVVYRPCYAVNSPVWMIYPICHNENVPIGKIIERRNKDIQVVLESQTTLEAMELGMELINKFVNNKDKDKYRWRNDFGQI